LHLRKFENSEKNPLSVLPRLDD